MSQYKTLILLCRLKRSRPSLSDLHLGTWHSYWLLVPKLPIHFLACIKNLERLVSIYFCLHGQKETVTEEAGEALIWLLIQCDNSMMEPVSIRLCKRWDWEEEHSCAKALPSSCSAKRQREDAVICVGMCSHTDRRRCQECGVKRYLKSRLTFRREALWVCLGQFSFLSELKSTTEKRAKEATVWSVTIGGRWRDDSKSLPANPWMGSMALADSAGKFLYRWSALALCLSCFKCWPAHHLLEKLAHTGQALFRNAVVSFLKE